MKHTLAALILVSFCALSGCTHQQINAFNAVVNGMNSAIAAQQRERALRAYEQQAYAPAPQTVVVIHRDER